MSPSELVPAVLTAAGGSAVMVAGLAGWLGKVRADRIAQAQKALPAIDTDLRTRRITVYEELWEATGILQDALADVLRAHPSGPLSDKDYESIRKRCSTALAANIQSRREGLE